MKIPEFEELLTHPAPAFLCEPPHGRGQFLTRIVHMGGPPATARQVAKWKKRASGSVGGEQLVDFVATRFRRLLLYSGVRLMKGEEDGCGLHLFPPGEWEEKSEDMQDGFEWLSRGGFPLNLEDCIAFGEVPQSGNYFCWVTTGKRAGSIVYLSHDPGKGEELFFARNFHEFLVKFSTDPVTLLNDRLGCYTRYCDGKTKTQWIPAQYFKDLKDAG